MTNKAKVIAAISGLAPETYRTKAEIARKTGLREDVVQNALNHISKEKTARFCRCVDFGGHRKHGYRMNDKAVQPAPKKPQVDAPRMPAKRTPPAHTPITHYNFNQEPSRAGAKDHEACPSLRDGVRVPYCPPKPMLVGKHSEIAWLPGRLG